MLNVKCKMLNVKWRKARPHASLGILHFAFNILHSAVARLHRDERGGALEYVMVFAFVAVPLIFLMEYMLEVLSDYFGLIAYYVTWPFL